MIWDDFVFACKNPYCVVFGHEPLTEILGNYTSLVCENCRCFLIFKDYKYRRVLNPVPVIKHLRKSEPCWDCACNFSKE